MLVWNKTTIGVAIAVLIIAALILGWYVTRPANAWWCPNHNVGNCVGG